MPKELTHFYLMQDHGIVILQVLYTSIQAWAQKFLLKGKIQLISINFEFTAQAPG